MDCIVYFFEELPKCIQWKDNEATSSIVSFQLASLTFEIERFSFC